MPTLNPIDARPPAPGLRVMRLTVDEYHGMLRAGILHDGDPIELIDGLLVHKDRSARGEDAMTIGKGHNLAIKRLNRLDPRLGPLGCHMQTQGPLTIGEHQEPEPDGVVLRGEPEAYRERLPAAHDACSVLEAADSSLDYDRTTKLELYARAGVAQYVIVNLVDARLEVFEQPVPAEGRYGAQAVVAADGVLALAVGEGRRLAVPARDLLP